MNFHRQSSQASTTRRGFTLIEIMVALALGALLSVGILSLFENTSRTNRLQDGLARLQENGRYAVSRMESDLRMLGAQFCSNRSGNAIASTVAPAWAGKAPMVFAGALDLPDSGGMRSVAAATGAASTAAATVPYALSPRFFVQGYACAAGACSPPASIPAAGLGVNDRVPNTDVFTIRYQRGTGWPLVAANCTAGGSLTVSPQVGDNPVVFGANQLAMVTDCQNPTILPVAGAAGSVISLGAVLGGGAAPTCAPSALRDVRVFNFSTDFVTVTYYLRFARDDSPDAVANNGGALRLIPTLVRQENGVAQELVQGIDLMEMRYGVQDLQGNTRFLTAAQVDTAMGGAITCSLKPSGVDPNPTVQTASEPGCLWRSVRSVEAHLLVNSVNDVGGIDAINRTYRFNSPTWVTTTNGSTLPSGLRAGDVLRREFIAQTMNRNYNP